MANEQNLKLYGEGHKLTVEEASKGGKASGKARRKKKTMAQFAAMIAKAPVAIENAREALRAAGISDDEMINHALVVFGVYRAAIEGDMKAVEKWQELTEPNEKRDTDSTIKIVMDESIRKWAE